MMLVWSRLLEDSALRLPATGCRDLADFGDGVRLAAFPLLAAQLTRCM